MEARTAVFPDEDAKPGGHPWVEALVTALDDRLRLRYGVFEYTRNPDCLFRIEIATSNDDFVLSDGVTVHAGDRLINLHVWNEQFPPFPKERPTLAWARRVDRAFAISLCELEAYLAKRPDLNDVVAVSGNMGFGPATRSAQLARYVARFGFERVASPQAPSLRRQIHMLGENILISMMVLARNAAALRADTLWRDRTLVFLSRRELQRRYGVRRERAA
jgi:YkoP-like protein